MRAGRFQIGAPVLCGFFLIGCARLSPLTSVADGGTDTSDAVTMPDARAVACLNDRGRCNPVNNAGCPSGYRCDIPEFICRSAGTGGWGYPCTSMDECREGFICAPNSRGASQGVCLKLCCQGDDNWCQDVASGGRADALCSTALEVGITVCGMPCDPTITANGCPAAKPYCAFNPLTDRFYCSEQTTTPPRPLGSSCAYSQDCSPGFACAGEPSTCMEMCNPTLTVITCRTARCTPNLPGHPEIGVCTP